jgi:hypothetical protein
LSGIAEISPQLPPEITSVAEYMLYIRGMTCRLQEIEIMTF